MGGLVPGGTCSGAVPSGDPPRDGYCCGRYASYWNAFLLLDLFVYLLVNCVNTQSYISIQNTFLSVKHKLFCMQI